MGEQTPRHRTDAGFSLIELLIAMAVSLVIMGMAVTLLAGTFNMRTRQDRRSDAIDDVQRALNIMTREIANSGYRLPEGVTYGAGQPVPTNGLLLGLCTAQRLAFVANLNALTTNASGTTTTKDNDILDKDEAVLFSLYTDATNNRRFLVRQDITPAGGDVAVLANRIDNVEFRYIERNPTTLASTLSAAGVPPTINTVGVQITVRVNLDAVGAPGSPGYQPAWQTDISSDVVLRNATLTTY